MQEQERKEAEKRKKERKANLAGRSGNVIFERLYDLAQSVDVVALVKVEDALRADGLPVVVAVCVDLLLWMVHTASDTRPKRGNNGSSWLQGLVQGDEVVGGRHLRLEVRLFARGTEGLGAVCTVITGLLILTDLTQHIVRISEGLVHVGRWHRRRR